MDAMNLPAGGAGIDVCCGTGDLAFEMARRVGGSGVVVGADFCEPMLKAGRAKAVQKRIGHIVFAAARADSLPFADGVFDSCGVAFGLRNVPDVHLALLELARVVRPGGRVVSLEIFNVRRGVTGAVWSLYFHYVAPRLVSLLGGKGQAYEYLSRSVAGFIAPEQLSEEFERCGLVGVEMKRFALGSVCVHVGTKVG